MTVKELRSGEMFTLKPIDCPKESQVFIKGDYDRSNKKYSCQRWSDISSGRQFKADTVVYTDFKF